MVERPLSNVIGFDDAPFPRDYRGPVQIVGAVYAGSRLDGVLIGAVEKDGSDATTVLSGLLRFSKFSGHVRLVMLQGIALAGFNVVDVFALSEKTALPVLVVSRRQPDMTAIREVLLSRIPGGEEKWRVLKRLGEMEPAAGIYIQRVGLTREQALSVLNCCCPYSHIPEPIRTAHLIAGALATGESRGAP